jgi:D,D-heptose 1,7-bisphosphate phosphatase
MVLILQDECRVQKLQNYCMLSNPQYKYNCDGSSLQVNIRYIIEEMPLGTAGSFFYMRDMIEGDFIYVFGDIIFDIDVSQMVRFHKSKASLATLLVHPNAHPYDSDLVVLDKNEKVTAFDSKHNKRDYYYDNCVNSGIYIFSPEICSRVKAPGKVDLEKDVLLKMVQNHEEVYGYHSTEYVKDIGTPERLKSSEIDINNGIVAGRNLSKKQKCIFLDRDGTINVYKGLLYREEDLELEEGVFEAIKELNRSEYLGIVITNQPVVARNLCSIEGLEQIHKKLKTLLGNSGAYLDDILYCPHHPDKGFEGENAEYKVECECRKPKTGLVEQCIRRYNIDPSSSWFIGDTTTDILTGKNAGLGTILLRTGQAGSDGKYQVEADAACDDLFKAIQYIRRKS